MILSMSESPSIKPTSQRSVPELIEVFVDSFQGLDLNQPGEWPLPPKIVAYILAVCTGFVLVWFIALSASVDTLVQAFAQESELLIQRDQLNTQVKLIPSLRKQGVDLERVVKQLEQSLPNRAEMDLLLSDINQIGLNRGLQFELFRPGKETLHDYYAELPIALHLSGSYNNIGLFTADLAKLHRIVTMQDMHLSLPQVQHPKFNAVNKRTSASANSADDLSLKVTLNIYRFLDASEVNANRSHPNKSVVRPKRLYEAPQPFEAEPFLSMSAYHPFHEMRLLGVTNPMGMPISESMNAEFLRPKGPLESYALDQIIMVGSLRKDGRAYALLRASDVIYTVRLGDYLGLNFGKVVRLSDSAVQIREWFQTPAGEWAQRTRSLELQEKRP
jgi:type IV pilus assembly protein PilO